MLELFTDYTYRSILLGIVLLSFTCGLLGTAAVLRRQSLVGDAISHAALPGICIGYMLFHSRSPLVIMGGAALSGGLAMALYQLLRTYTKLEPTAILGSLLTTFFGLGVVLLTVIQKTPDAGQAGLDKFLFGQAANLTTEHIITIGVVSLIALVIFYLVYQPFRVLAFDPTFAQASGLPTHAISTVLTILLVMSVVIGLNAVGVVLLSAMLVAPSVAARQWTNNLSPMVILAGLIGAITGSIGAAFSMVGPGVPTGPIVIVVMTASVILSLIFGTARGVLWRNRATRGGRA